MIQRDQRIKDTAAAGATTIPTQPTSASVWTAGLVAPSNSVWNASEPAPAAEPSTATTVPPPPTEEIPAPETVNYFYDSLAPYGTWVDVSGYGRCWRPTVVVTTPGWRPYSHGGRWEWTDSGWYWYSDYSWGWAPFHYGRWFSHPRWGWCWVPGSTWGPSWVSWRYSDSYCGWSPLPPAACYSPSIGFTYFGRSCGSSFSFGLTWDCFTFVSYNNFRSRRYDRDCVPRNQVGRVYNNTTVVNNIIRGNNNTIINNGIAPTQITANGGAPIKQVNIREGRGPRGGGNGGSGIVRHEEIAHDGNIRVVRPTVPTGRGHTTVTAGNGPARGGSQGLNSGNAAPAPAPGITPTPSSGGLVPPRGGNAGAGPRRNVPTAGNNASTPAPIKSLDTPAPAAAANAVASNPAVPGTGGTRPPRGAGSVWSSPTTPGTSGTPNTSGTQNGGTRGTVISRNPRLEGGPKESPTTTGNGFAQPGGSRGLPAQPNAPTAPAAPSAPSAPTATPAPTPTAPVVASTPAPARITRTPATPWLNNNNNTPSSSSSPVRTPQVTEPTGPSRNVWSGSREPRSANTWNSANNIPRSTAPSAVAPTVRSTPSPAPSYQAPSAPTRTYTAPAIPQQSQPSQRYNPPARSERYTPPSQPTFSQPSREVRSAPVQRSEPRSAPSSSGGSSSRGSDSSGRYSSSRDNSQRGR